MIDQHLDAAWVRRTLIDDNLSRWLAAAPTQSGFFRAALDRRWRPAERQEATLVSQCRLLYVFSVGWELTNEAAYRQAVRRGADFLCAHFRDEAEGGWFLRCGPDGSVLDDGKDSYGHAFVILGLAHAGRALQDAALVQAAADTWDEVRARLCDERGGLVRRATRDFRPTGGAKSQNPVMHMFEAVGALHEVAATQQSFAGLTDLAAFLFDGLFEAQAGRLDELYDGEWHRLPEASGGYVDVGHQFELAYLLARAVARGLPDRYLRTAHRLADWGMRFGYDRPCGGVFSRCGYNGRVIDADKGWWQQAELLRALMYLAEAHGREDLWQPFDQSLAFVRENFLDAEHGGWFAGFDPSTSPDDRPTYKGSTWKVGYHATGLFAEALRLLESQRG